MKALLVVLLLSASMVAPAQADQSMLPNPFTLDDALNWSVEASPAFVRQQALQALNDAKQAEASAQQGLNIGFVGRLGQREFMNERQDFNLAALSFSAPLYDFGRHDQLLSALAIESSANEQLKHYYTLQYRWALMQGVFDVLLADLHYRVKNEAMAIAFVTLDRVEEDFALDRVSEQRLTESRRDYQAAFLARQQAQLGMRQARMRLGNALGLGATIVPRVEVPREIKLPTQLESLDTYQQRLEAQNPLLRALNFTQQAKQQRVDFARYGQRPLIRAEARVGQLSSYPRLREGRWEAGLILEVPLYDSGLTQTHVDKAMANVSLAQADYDQQAQLLRNQLTELYFELSLLAVEEQAIKENQNFAHVNFDLARALYENELQADFGNALVEISQSDLDELAFRFRKVLLWSQLNLLLGAEDLLNFDQMVKESTND
ncbi:TolC family protein [Thiomicrospira sp. ALE5]|uniref:TolC family protein n=1 Tax=Thiomicrospira sp. ALE5 TaxID=748650 RepID=UPI0008E099FB|nr:TolC family protein [Thiomicrospira sp. ALE5]SFR58553.1 Outer membrane protein TolC [Thiomicrospira sp. ALE5]